MHTFTKKQNTRSKIVGFTVLSAQISPEELLVFLNKFFSAFDGSTEKYGLEKIKIIGDAYMVEELATSKVRAI